MRKKLALMALAAIIFSISLARAYSAQKRGSSSASSVKERPVKLGPVRPGPVRLGNVEQFKTAFQNDQGKVRLVALISPT
jgi:hypothetical protein